MTTTTRKPNAPMDGLLDVQDSTLNSSLAEILASMAADDGPNNTSGGGSRADSPLLGEQQHEILSNSLQEFLKYEDPHSPVLTAVESSAHAAPAGSEAIEEVETAPTATASPATPAARSPHFTMHRNPSFTPSLKGFLFSKDDGVVGRIETTTCSLTGSGSESSDPHTYLPRLTDGSVSVLHSIENDLQDLSSIDDSMRSDEDSSSSNDRDSKLTGMVDLGSLKAELDMNFGVRLHNHNALGGNPAPAPTNVSGPVDKLSDESSPPSPAEAAGQRVVETVESKRQESSRATDRKNTPKEGTQTIGKKGDVCVVTSRDAGSTSHVSQEDSSLVLARPASANTSMSAVPIVQPAEKTIPEVPLTQPEPSLPPSEPLAPPAVQMEQSPQLVTPSKQSSAQRLPTQVTSPTQSSAVPLSPSPLSNAGRLRRSSIGNDQCAASPAVSPSHRRLASTPRRRSSTGSTSARPRDSPPPAAPSLSPSPKHRSKSSSRTKEKKANALKTSPSIHTKETQVVPSQNPDADVELTAVSRLPSNSSSERRQTKAPKSPTLSVSREVELPAAPGSPKSPHRELRLKIQIDELRSPNRANGSERGNEGVEEDEALPQMLKMLLDGVANKIRKHAKQESMRKIRTMETSGSPDVESPPRGVRHQFVPSGSPEETSGSPRQRIKVRIDKSKASSPRKDGKSSSLSPSKSGRRRVSLGKTEEKTNDFDPHSVRKSGGADEHREARDRSQSSRRHKERSSEERIRSRSTKPDHGKHDRHHREEDLNPQKVPRSGPESTAEKPRRRSVERDASSRRVSGSGRHDEHVRSKSSSEDRQHRSSRSRSKTSSATSRTKPQQRDDAHHEKNASLKSKLDEGPDRSSRGSGSRSVCSRSSRKRREDSNSEANDSSHHRSRKPSDADAKATSLAIALEREDKKKIGSSSSRSVCSRSSRKLKDGADERKLSHSYHSRSVHSCSKSVHSSSKSVHSASKSSVHSTSKCVPPTVDPSTPPLKPSESVDGRSDATEAIEYDFNDDPPQKGADGDRQGRSFRRGSGPSSARGRSQSSRRLRTGEESGLTKTGRSQSQRHIQSERTSSLSSSRRSQSHRHLKSEEPEYQLGLGLDSPSHRTSSRSNSQPPASSRHARPESAQAESVERSGARRSRSRPAPPEGRKELSLSGLSRSQLLEEGAKSVASGASDRTPRRSGGRGPSPNARTRAQPTSLLGHMGKQQAPGPPGRSPVVQPQGSTTVGRLRGAHKALSFRDLFGRDQDPWQEFTSPTRQPKPSCLPVVGTTAVPVTAAAAATPAVGTTTTKGRSMPKFLSAVGNSFQRSSSSRFPEVSKSELEASFDPFHPFESSGGVGVLESDKPLASMSSSTTSSSTPPSPPLSGSPQPMPMPPLQPPTSERGWTQKFFR